MGEKIYKAMKRAGASNIVLGIIMITVGTVVGVLTIISGAKLLKNKSEIMF